MVVASKPYLACMVLGQYFDLEVFASVRQSVAYPFVVGEVVEPHLLVAENPSESIPVIDECEHIALVGAQA